MTRSSTSSSQTETFVALECFVDKARMSLSFYGKRPGPGMKLDQPSMQFSMQETHWAGAVLEAYERLVHDPARGDRTLFTTPVRPYEPGTWGPNLMGA